MAELSPLSERIEAPRLLELPIHPDVALWRPALVSDAAEIAALHEAADAADHPEWLTSPDDVLALLTADGADPAHDSNVGVTDAGRVVAYGFNVFQLRPGAFARVTVHGTTHPEVRGHGLGRQLLQWQRGRAQQMLAASELPLPGIVVMSVQQQNVQAVRLAELLGFHAVLHVPAGFDQPRPGAVPMVLSY